MVRQAVTPSITVDNFTKGLVNDTLNTMRQIVTLQKRINALLRLATLVFPLLLVAGAFSEEQQILLVLTAVAIVNEITDVRRQLRDQKQHLKNNLILLREVTP